MEHKIYKVAIDVDPETGDYLIPFSDELLEGLDWKDGDTIKWIDNNDGSWTLIKINSVGVEIDDIK